MPKHTWTKEDITKLKKNFSTNTNLQMCEIIPTHSYKGIEKKGTILGLLKTPAHISKATRKRKENPLGKYNDKLVGRPIRVNQQTLEVRKGKNYAELLFFGDLHYGSLGCDIDRAKRQLEYCLENNVYVLIMGDMIDCGLKSSVGASVYEQLVNVQSQIEFILDLLKPLVEAGLVVGIHTGNHEDRVTKEAGIDITKNWARELNIPYLGSACWSVFTVGSQRYTCYSLHGSSGSRFLYTKLKALLDISHSFSADIMAMGHVHELDSAFQLVQRLVGNTVVEVKKLIILTGHYVKYEGGYVQRQGYPISKLGSPKIKLFADKKDIHVSN